MKKAKMVHLKSLLVAIMAFLTTGCVNIIHQYSPQKAINWKKEYTDYYKYQCNGSEVGVFSLQTYPQNGDRPSLSIDIRDPKGQKPCELSFLWLESNEVGQRVNPIKVEELFYNDKMTTICSYSFDITENKEVRYTLHISDQLLGCPINPIPYIFEKTWEVQPQQLM